jgi:hypothetical protein
MWPSGSSPTMVNSRIWTSWRTCGKAFQTLTCMALDSLALHGQGAVGSVHMACHVRFVMPCHDVTFMWYHTKAQVLEPMFPSSLERQLLHMNFPKCHLNFWHREVQSWGGGKGVGYPNSLVFGCRGSQKKNMHVIWKTKSGVSAFKEGKHVCPTGV